MDEAGMHNELSLRVQIDTASTCVCGMPRPGSSIASPQVSPEAELPLQHSPGVAVALRGHMQREDARAGGQEAAPEQAQAEEAGALLDRQQQTPNGRCKRRGHTCSPDITPAGSYFALS